MNGMLSAHLRNQIAKKNLVKELDKLEKIQKADLRMLRCKERQLLGKVFNHEKSSIHGETEKIYTMLLTDEEVDVEKVLCLHLLAAHNVSSMNSAGFLHKTSSFPQRSDTESRLYMEFKNSRTFLPEPDYWNISFLPPQKRNGNLNLRRTYHKKSSSQESDKDLDTHLMGVSKLLPTYILEVRDSISESEEDEQKPKKCDLNMDVKCELSKSRESKEKKETKEKKSLKSSNTKGAIRKTTLFINNKIEILVDTVIKVLQKANPNKFQEILELAKSPHAIRKLLEKQKIQSFIDSLCDEPLISDSLSFHFSKARICNTLKNVSTENLVEYTDYSPFKLDGHNSGKKELTALQLDVVDTSPTSSLERIMGKIRNSVLQETPSSSIASLQHKNKFKMYETLSPVPLKCSNTSLKYPVPFTSLDSKIESNLHTGSNITLTSLENISSINRGVNKTTLTTLASTIMNPQSNIRFSDKMKQQYEEVRKNVVQKPLQTTKNKFSIRRTTCPACIQQWKFRKPISEQDNRNTSSTLNLNERNKKFMSTKEIEEILNFVTATGDENVSEKIPVLGVRRSMQESTCVKGLLDSSSKHDQINNVNSLLRRLSNPQRIRVGRKVASIKSKQINAEGLEGKDMIPISSILSEVLSQTSIEALQERYNVVPNKINRLIKGEGNLKVEPFSITNMKDFQQKLRDSKIPATTISKESTKIRIPKDNLELEKIKFDIANRETDIKVIKFLKSKNL